MRGYGAWRAITINRLESFLPLSFAPSGEEEGAAKALRIIKDENF